MSNSCEWSPVDFYSEYFPVARKRHDCCECEAPINPGEKHLRASGRSDGAMWDARQHMICRELCMLMNRDGDGCCYFGGMKEEWQEADWWLGPKHSKRQARTLYARILKRERALRKVESPGREG